MSASPLAPRPSLFRFSLLNQSENPEAAAGAEEPQRPKLQLAPRTKPLPDAKNEAGAQDDGEGEGEGEDEGAAAKDEMTDEEAKRKIANDIKEFLEIRDVEGAVEETKVRWHAPLAITTAC